MLISAPQVPVAPSAFEVQVTIYPPVEDTEPPEVAATSNPYCGNDALTVIVKLDLTSKDPEEVFGNVAVEGKAALDVIDEIV